MPSLRTVEVADSRPAPGAGAEEAMLMVVADPVFERGDPRIDGGGVARVALARDAPAAIRTRSTSALEGLQRLPATAEETRSIEALVPAAQRMTLTGASATREAVLDADLRYVRYPAFRDTRVCRRAGPQLSALVLSRLSGGRLATGRGTAAARPRAAQVECEPRRAQRLRDGPRAGNPRRGTGRSLVRVPGSRCTNSCRRVCGRFRIPRLPC